MGDGDDLTPFADGWDVLIETRRVQHRFEVAMDQCLEGLGLSYAQYRALELLLAAKQMHVSELARRLCLTRQAANATAEKLARAGYLRLHREPHVTYLEVTELARRRLSLLRRVADVRAALDRELSGPERAHLVALLRKAERAVRPPARPTWWLE